jgi:hypothetical protein
VAVAPLLPEKNDVAGRARRPVRMRRSVPYAIADLPPEIGDAGAPLLIFCGPEHGGWRPGVRDEHGWRDPADATQRLEPSHFALVSGRSPREQARRFTVMLAAGVVMTVAAVLAIGQVAYGDPWALCAPGVGAPDVAVPRATQVKGAGDATAGR